jgi:hypothetical protein
VTVRRAAALVLLGAVAAGCGIRPTAVPVDAGAPASRTACPTPVQVPKAAAATTAAPTGGGTATAGKSPAVKSPAPEFSVAPSPSPAASHCP